MRIGPVAAAAAALIMVFGACLVSSADSSEAASEVVYDMGVHEYTTNTRSQVFALGTANTDEAFFAQAVSHSVQIGEYSFSSNAPSWITWEVKPNDSKFYLTIIPGAPSDGNYTLTFNCYGYSSNIVCILKIHVIVTDSGTVVPDPDPSTSNTFELLFDTQGGNAIGPVRKVTVDDSMSVALANYVPVKNGYTFLGWASVPGSDVVDMGDYAIVNETTSPKTVYAVWEPAEPETLILPTLWDGLIEILSNPLIVGGMAAFMLMTAFMVRGRS